LKGCAAVCFYVTEPEKMIGSIHGKGDWLGVNSIGENYTVVASIEVIQETELIFFRRTNYSLLLKLNHEFIKFCLMPAEMYIRFGFSPFYPLLIIMCYRSVIYC
jgi:hypothetical protein